MSLFLRTYPNRFPEQLLLTSRQRQTNLRLPWLPNKRHYGTNQKYFIVLTCTIVGRPDLRTWSSPTFRYISLWY